MSWQIFRRSWRLSLHDFLVDETYTPAEKDAADHEFDELFLETIRLLDKVEAIVEDMEFYDSETPTDSSEKNSSDFNENASMEGFEILQKKVIRLTMLQLMLFKMHLN